MRSMSQRTECLLVLIVAFALPVLSSVMSLLTPSTGPAVTEAGLRALVVYEAVILAALLPLLRVRGWQRAHFGATWHGWDLPAGVLLTTLVFAACVAVDGVLRGLADVALPSPDALVARDIPIATIALASALNALFEELFLCGHLIGVLKPARGAAFAINASTALRLSYHLYQGAPSIAVIPIGLLFAAWYVRTGRLWPLVLAHAAFDVFALMR